MSVRFAVLITLLLTTGCGLTLRTDRYVGSMSKSEGIGEKVCVEVTLDGPYSSIDEDDVRRAMELKLSYDFSTSRCPVSPEIGTCRSTDTLGGVPVTTEYFFTGITRSEGVKKCDSLKGTWRS